MEHPGIYIRDQIMKPKNLKLSDIASAMDLSLSTACRLINGQSTMNAEVAIKASYVLGETPEFWMEMQIDHSIHEAAKKVDINKLTPLKQIKTSKSERAA